MPTSRSILRLCIVAATAVLLSAQTATAMGNATKGERVFKKCKACHNLAKNKHKVGPTLVGIIDRPAATAVDGKGKAFKYSKGMKKAGADGIVWTPANLEKFLTKPKGFVPKTRMAFPGLKRSGDRADVIAYLKAQSK
jgi:cytochrome c